MGPGEISKSPKLELPGGAVEAKQSAWTDTGIQLPGTKGIIKERGILSSNRGSSVSP
ncbi:uncharacterized protein M421DRAFT_421617 [Didymella exigua CBS 183.55]|uniref:Uncharacterized protein n=1 Tax=Didymella exigua CBS 183.55 TaxID=1150837 RepID=A0A6A5RLC0_9PLEO|nr:uncharacterized protein M421DRAFT_421617 [Didymella exigua CBS 183.55]KAF1927774.1 hypothetical protein M421DRAFT_421617 [Didymella exigua CBS 183.55]